MRSTGIRSALWGLTALAASAAVAHGQSFTPGDVYWAGSFTPAQLIEVTGGGNFAGVPPLVTLAGRSIGQLAWSSDRSTLYITLFALNRVDAITASGVQSTFATGVSGPTGLIATRDGRLLVASFSSGEVIDITAGGDFTGAPAFASGLAGARNMVQLTDDRILSASQSSGRVFDITAGGNFGADPGFAFGLSSPVDLVQDAAGQIFVSEASASQVTNITAGGDFTGLPAFAFGRQFAGLTIDGSGRLLANLLVGTSAYDISAGGNFSAAPAWAFNLPFAETAFDTVPPIRCGDNMLDPMEQCDDGNTVAGDCCSATCQFEALNAPCPDDGVACTIDRCNGTGSCQHPAGNVGALCRAATGACDLAETCNGVSSSCPSDALQPSGTVCRTSAGTCDLTEVCNGLSPGCPADTVQASGVSCRAAAGTCDVGESCTGASPSCPPDGVLPSGSVCRATAGACDAAESCDGSAATCPPDARQPSGTVCRAAAGACDAAEVCDGAALGCPVDALRPAGASCRGAAGVCDVAESCTGGSPSCPVDAKSTAVCRAAVGVCDLAEQCDGAGNDCPADATVADGVSCADGAFCNGEEQCQSSVCIAGTTPCGGFCDESADACITGCPPAPQACRNAAKSLVLLRHDPTDKLIWKWIKGVDETTLADLGDPTTATGTNYALCLYTGNPALLITGGELKVPAAPSLWSQVREVGFNYKDLAATANGIFKIKLRAGEAGKPRAFVKGKGAALPDQALPIAPADLPLIVQLLNDTNTVCWQSSFDNGSVVSNRADLFKAVTP